MKFSEYILDKINSTILFKMAFDNKKIEEKILGLQKPINLHLIKIIRYKDDINYQKHINDIMSWLEDIQDMDFLKKGRKFSKELYFKLLFTEPFTNTENIDILKNWEKRGSLKDYSELPKKCSEQETMYKLENIQKEISELLSRNEIYDIEFSLNKLI